MVDEKKLKSVVAYLSASAPGKVKLFKLMYLADFTAYARLGRSITGETYENWTMGPVPVTVWRGLKSGLLADAVILENVPTGAIPEQQFRPRPGFIADLAGDERRILDEILERFDNSSGNELRDFTHRTIPYRASQRGDSIKYGLAPYLWYQKPRREDLDRLLEDQSLIGELRAALAAA
jgi:uncharacterized phage-associated protein